MNREYYDPREEQDHADIFCGICGECKSWVETTEAIGFGIYRKVWLCEDCDVAPAGYDT